MNITETELASMSWSELRELNKRVIRFLRLKSKEMQDNEYHIGDRISFDRGLRSGGWVNGTIMKVNSKTVKITDDDGVNGWRVSPVFLYSENHFIENKEKESKSTNFMEELKTL